MKFVNMFVKDPCVGWFFVNRSKFDKDYSCTDEFTEDFINNFDIKFKLERKEVEQVSNAYIIRLVLRSEFSINHPDSNQANYYAEAVLVKE